MDRRKKGVKTKVRKPWSDGQEISDLRSRLSQIDLGALTSVSGFCRFDDPLIPLSKRSLDGLSEMRLKTLTDIQKSALLPLLKGNSALLEAPTGSGKTLCFGLAILERLYRHRFTSMDGAGALVLTPTRELAHQIHDVIHRLGKFHETLASVCVMGGRFFDKEQRCLGRTSIVVGSCGRVLQHMEETEEFSTDNIHILVLDEADRLVESSFLDTLIKIKESLPERIPQTVLCSATLEASGQALKQAGFYQEDFVLCKPNLMEERVRGDWWSAKSEKHKFPELLSQRFVQVPFNRKLDLLIHFLRRHHSKKIIVFCATSKEVRFLSKLFTLDLKTGARVLEYHANRNQVRRLQVFSEFSKRKRAVTLFATDIAERGVDFEGVDLIIQYDSPFSVDEYIHRVGRTARCGLPGFSVLFLLPEERDNVLTAFKRHNILIEPKKGKKTVADADLTECPSNTLSELNLDLSVGVTSKIDKAKYVIGKYPELSDYATSALTNYCRSLKHGRLGHVPMEMMVDQVRQFAVALGVPPPSGAKVGATGPSNHKKENRKLNALKAKVLALRESRKLTTK